MIPRTPDMTPTAFLQVFTEKTESILNNLELKSCLTVRGDLIQNERVLIPCSDAGVALKFITLMKFATRKRGMNYFLKRILVHR